MIHDHIRMRLGAGFEIKEIITGFETHWVVLGNLPLSITPVDIENLLQPFGRVADVRLFPRTNSQTAKARMSSTSEAREACAHLNKTHAFNTKITAKLPANDEKRTVYQDTAVLIRWRAPGKCAYGGYSKVEQASKAIAAARTPFGDRYVRASIHAGVPAVGEFTVKFDCVAPDTTRKDMEERFAPEDIVWQRPDYEDLSRAIGGIKKILGAKTPPLTFEVLPPPYRDGGMVCAWAQFANAADAKTVCNHLNGLNPLGTGKTTVSARHILSITYQLSNAVYTQLADEINALRKICIVRGVTRVSVVRRPVVRVKLSGEDLKDLGPLKAEFEIILNGEVLREQGKVVWDGFFVRVEGVSFLQGVERSTGVTVQKDSSRRLIRLRGSSHGRTMARRKILAKYHELRSQQVRTVPLPGRLIGLFMSKNLTMLQEEHGSDNIYFDINRHLKVRGNDVVFDAAQEAVRRLRLQQPPEHFEDVVGCPVCFDQVTQPVTLSCGHSWCRSCFSDYLLSSIDNRMFPLKCLGNEAKCSVPISVTVAREKLPAHDFEAIVKAAFSSYVQRHPDEFHYCPSPNCPQVYRAPSSTSSTLSPSSKDNGTVLQCPSCLLRICPICHDEAHDGLGCPESGDDLFEEWMRNHDVKNCPGCRVPIERAAGCNHMTCTQCQTHICWVCLQTFPNGQGIYDHMRRMHGSIWPAPT